MNAFWYGLFAVILAVLSFFTGEIVTFLMLGFVLISLQNIHMTLKKLVQQKENE
ncbi:hypothetical protein [Radiobacillus deserti]|uniref:hypothetical protein n=1 Tax=Radiobacillus deserti TaxID=2594883 RepID=UPI00188B227B|nr:hypothetical protein [Radiobacillus deserti]